MDTVFDIYKLAEKNGRQVYLKRVSEGKSGYLPSLDGLLRNSDIMSEVNIGVIDAPLKKVVGTTSHSRATAFTKGFLPLSPYGSEFSTKWCALYEAHVEEGIRDPITAFEYMNYFYVREGNKRVSVLKYADAYSVEADVRRIIPKRDPSDKLNSIYYEFLDFNRQTGIFTIWFSEEGRFPLLGTMLESYNPDVLEGLNKYQHFLSNVYAPFRTYYFLSGGDRLPITTGDALLHFLKVYGMPGEITQSEHEPNIKKMIPEFMTMRAETRVTLITEPLPQKSEAAMISALTRKMGSKVLKVGFVYAKTSETSGWTYSHEQGRLHVGSILGTLVETYSIENVPQNADAYHEIRRLADSKLDAIFTTSPTFNMQTLKAALEYPKVKFFNCSQNDSFSNVRTYYGRIYEVKFLLGIIAGAMTRNNLIGYVATYPISEVISAINAFALGASLVNPHAKIHVYWAYRWQYQPFSVLPATELTKLGADLITQEDLPVENLRKKTYGLFTTKYDSESDSYIPDKQYAIPVWHWGIFYEKILGSIMNDTWKRYFEGGSSDAKPVNFWWGINSGLVDIFYSLTHLPRETQKLVDFMRRMIIQDEYNVFQGPIEDQAGEVRIPEGKTADRNDIVSMNYFVKNVIGDIPLISTAESADPLTEKKGFKSL